jgi:ribulose bisphosphate carboxylase small subunit
MEHIFVNDCPACEPVNRLVGTLLENGFKIIEQYLDDFHFHQLYFKVEGNINLLEVISMEGFSREENKFICDCHWSTVEIIEDISSDIVLC